MQIEINNLKQPIEAFLELPEAENIRRLAAVKLKLRPEEIPDVRILRKSVDARDKGHILFVYSIRVTLPEGYGIAKLKGNKDMEILPPDSADGSKALLGLRFGMGKIKDRPIIIGSGPAGLFAGLILAEHGYMPLILERGTDVDRRTNDIARFFKSGVFDEGSNVQFGEGGAGTFSDGKLTARSKDWRCSVVLERFVQAGAPAEILYLNKPHIGTDILKPVIKNIRSRIMSLGGEVRFDAKVTDVVIEGGAAKAVIVNDSEKIESNVIIAALGHSARDTYKMLYARDVRIIPKPFSIGVRIEHWQRMIDEAQYGQFAGHPALGAADYILTFRSNTTGRSAYSFCMCPGGMVVAAASEKDMVVTNGMSEYKRDRENANSALVVSVSPEDFADAHPLSGIEFQRSWEKKAYQLGGGGYAAPVQLVGDFMKAKASSGLGRIKPSYRPGAKPADLAGCLPPYVIATMREAMKDFDRKIKGFGDAEAVMTGVETRTSAPVRIVRNEHMESENTANLYPVGEGAGYAGGIVSAAVDGIKVAERIIERYKPL